MDTRHANHPPCARQHSGAPFSAVQHVLVIEALDVLGLIIREYTAMLEKAIASTTGYECRYKKHQNIILLYRCAMIGVLNGSPHAASPEATLKDVLPAGVLTSS